jgi:hypothetical protein
MSLGLLTNWFYDHRSSIQFRDHGSHWVLFMLVLYPIAAAIILGSKTELPLK